MILFQCFPNGNGQDGSEDNRHSGIEDRCGNLADDGHQGSFGGETLLEHAAPVIGLAQVQSCVSHRDSLLL